eukprot:3933019-Rhodomonas_salina.1
MQVSPTPTNISSFNGSTPTLYCLSGAGGGGHWGGTAQSVLFYIGLGYGGFLGGQGGASWVNTETVSNVQSESGHAVMYSDNTPGGVEKQHEFWEGSKLTFGAGGTSWNWTEYYDPSAHGGAVRLVSSFDANEGCYCLPGFYRVGGSSSGPCVECPAGSYCPGGPAEQVVKCPLNMDSDVSTTRVEDCFCKPNFMHNDGDDAGCVICEYPSTAYISPSSPAAPSMCAGFDHFCAIFDNGCVKCWGSTLYCKLGNCSYANNGNSAMGDAPLEIGRHLPFLDFGIGQFAKTITCGAWHTCVLLYSNEVKCWGRNTDYQLGLGHNLNTGVDPMLPSVDVARGRPGVYAVQVSAGSFHTCALLSDGVATCWGRNVNGALGIGYDAAVSHCPFAGLPVVMFPHKKGLKQILALQDLTIVLFEDGEIFGWENFDIIKYDFNTTLIPTHITRIQQIGFCAIFSPGRAKCAGRLIEGVSRMEHSYLPELNPPWLDIGPEYSNQIVSISGYGYFACANLLDGRVVCWGRNQWYSLGLGHDDYFGWWSEVSPVLGLNGSFVVGVTASSSTGCALLSDGTSKCWGDNRQRTMATGVVGGPDPIREDDPWYGDLFVEWNFYGKATKFFVTEPGILQRTPGSVCMHCFTVWPFTDRESCENVAAGYFRNGTTFEIELCPAGHWCPGGGLPPVQCPDHTEVGPGASVPWMCTCQSTFFGSCDDVTDCARDFCQPCLEGHFCNGGSKITACPVHSSVGFGMGAMATDCVCMPGFSGAGGGYYCTECPANMWCPGGVNEQHHCPQHSFSVAASTQIESCSCGAGYYGLAGSTCTECSKGFWCSGGVNGGDAVSIACPLYASTLSVGSVSVAECICSAGYYRSGNESNSPFCQPCLPDHYCSGDGAMASCPDANSAADAQTVSVSGCTCNAGFEGENGGSCTLCTVGWYCEGGSHRAQCISNSISDAGASSADACTCKPGFYGSQLSGMCTVCPVGQWCPGGAIVSLAHACPGHATTSGTGASTLQECFCVAGYVNDTGTCIACPVDHYCPSGGGTLAACPAHSDTGSFAGATSATDCLCSEGYKGEAGGPCVACNTAENEVCPGGGAGVLWCPPHSTARAGAATVSDCECDPGFVGNDGGQCEPCESDSYCVGGNASVQCPLNSGTLSGGASSLQDCVCKSGFWGAVGEPCAICPAGSYCAGGGENVISACPEHSSSNAQAWHLGDCACVAGFYGALVCTVCPVDQYCRGGADVNACPQHAHTNIGGGATSATECACEAGWYGADGSVCTLCDAGYYCGGSIARHRCGDHSVSMEGATDESACRCVAGYFFDANVTGDCVRCLDDHYCEGDALDRRILPKPCPSNLTTAASGAASVDACICIPGFFGVGGVEGCDECPPDRFCEGGNSVSSCPSHSHPSQEGGSSENVCVCNRGYVGRNATSCSLVAVGYYSLGGEISIQCPSDSSTAFTGADSKDGCVCNAGFYRSTGVDWSCLACPMGSYCAGGGGAGIHACPLHMVTMNTMATSLDECFCGAGYFLKNTSLDGVGIDVICDACNIDKYCVGDGFERDCPFASGYAGRGAESVDQCVCNSSYSGSVSDSAGCVECAAGAFCPGGGAQYGCQQAHTWSKEGSVRSTDCMCNMGYFGNAGGPCNECREDFWCAGDAVMKIDACPENSRSPGGARSRMDCICKHGFFASFSFSSEGVFSCEGCPANHFCPMDSQIGQPVLVACAMNAVSPPFSRSHLDCFCPVGYKAIGSNPSDAGCETCSAGEFCVLNQTLQCPAHSTSDVGATSVEDCKCNA